MNYPAAELRSIKMNFYLLNPDAEHRGILLIKIKKEFIKLLTTPGIGNILGLTITLEVGNIGRFPKAGNYSSYSRCVESKKTSNGKKKGENNKKNGNRYLAWAYVEAANQKMGVRSLDLQILNSAN